VKFSNYGKNNKMEYRRKESVVDNKSFVVKLGRFPNIPLHNVENSFNKRANRYLSFQENRIKKAILQGETEKGILI
jgi:hypothetical protein